MNAMHYEPPTAYIIDFDYFDVIWSAIDKQ